MIEEYDPHVDAKRCYEVAIAEIRKAHVAAEVYDWRTLPELYAWEASQLFRGKWR